MAVAAVTMVKDEADIIEATVRNIAAQVDFVLVADNRSDDDTYEILQALKADYDLDVIPDGEVGYHQSRKMTALAHRAGQRGADWIVPFDADEIWYCTWGPISEQLAGIGPGCFAVTAELYDHVSTGMDPSVPDPVQRIGWRRQAPVPLPKVAVRYRDDLRIHQGNHACDFGGVLPHTEPLLVVRHFPYRSEAQFIRKVRNGSKAYKATSLPTDTGAHWRQWGDILDSQGEDAVAEIFRTWFYREAPAQAVTIHGETQPPLIFDPAPCRR